MLIFGRPPHLAIIVSDGTRFFLIIKSKQRMNVFLAQDHH